MVIIPDSLPALRSHRRLFGVLLALCALSLCLLGNADAFVSFNGDWQTGDNSQWQGLECPNPSTQFAVVTAPPGRDRYAARFSVSPTDIWAGDNTVRCLDVASTGETTGNDYYYGLSVYNPAPGIGDNLIWELHHPQSLYDIPGCGVAPYALLADQGRLVFRIAGGNCVVNSGWTQWEPAIPLPGFDPIPRDTWIDVVIHIRFSESAVGLVEVWARTGSKPWPASPLISRSGIPTLPYATSADVHNVTLYTELGLYKGGSAVTADETVYLSGYRRGASFADVAAAAGATGNVGAPAPVPAPAPAPARGLVPAARPAPAPAPGLAPGAIPVPASAAATVLAPAAEPATVSTASVQVAHVEQSAVVRRRAHLAPGCRPEPRAGEAAALAALVRVRSATRALTCRQVAAPGRSTRLQARGARQRRQAQHAM